MSTHHLSSLGGTIRDSTKSAPRHDTLKLCFQTVGCTSHVLYSGAPGARNIDALFFILVCAQWGFVTPQNSEFRNVTKIY
jgi:hypothetical protein